MKDSLATAIALSLTIIPSLIIGIIWLLNKIKDLK